MTPTSRTRWRLIKTRFARALPKQERRSAVRQARNERGIWQRRFWEHLIRDDADYARHVEYCYINPVSTMASSGAFVIGRTRRSTATPDAASFLSIGLAKSSRRVNLVSENYDRAGRVRRSRNPPLWPRVHWRITQR